MAKLNKQEVNAIAGKLQRELTKIAEIERKKAMKVYVPSAKYSSVKALIDEMNSKCKAKSELSERISQIRNELYQKTRTFAYEGDDNLSLLDSILREECKLKEIPSIEELKEEITISAIDDSFDTLAFINDQINKFKS